VDFGVVLKFAEDIGRIHLLAIAEKQVLHFVQDDNYMRQLYADPSLRSVMKLYETNSIWRTFETGH